MTTRWKKRWCTPCNHTPQGDVGQDLTIISAQYGFEVSHPVRGRRIEGSNFSNSLPSARSHPARGRRTSTDRSDNSPIIIESHPARGHRRPPRFTAQFCAAKRGGCFFVKFWTVPDFSRNFSNCGSFHSFYIRIQTVSHWKFPQKAVEISLFPAFFFAGSRAIMGTNLFKPVFRIFPCYFARRR